MLTDINCLNGCGTSDTEWGKTLVKLHAAVKTLHGSTRITTKINKNYKIFSDTKSSPTKLIHNLANLNSISKLYI